MDPRRLLAALPLLLACDACDAGRAPPTAPPPPPAPAAEAPAATPAPGAAPAPAAGPPQPPVPPQAEPAAALVREVLALQPGDADLPLPADGEAAVDPSSSFRVVLSAPSKDARLALLDASDAAVPAVATTEVGQGTVLALAPSAPLVPGARYRLRLDGAVGRELHAGERPFLPASWELRAAGQPPPTARPPHRAKLRHR